MLNLLNKLTGNGQKKRPSEVKKVATFCYQCNAGPDLLKVDVEDGVATCVQPNFDAKGIHPADGRVCVKAYGLIQKAYNPNRVLTPMKRTNPKKGRHEDPGFVPISWDEALDTVAGKLNAVRKAGLEDKNGYPRVAVSFGEAGNPVSFMGTFTAFLAAWGPIDYGLGGGQGIRCYHSEHFFSEMWHRSYTVAVDAPHCNFVISFGSNTDASGGVLGVHRHANARLRGMKKVQVEPHLSVTGAHADDWIAIKPKTDGAMMFALLNVLLFERDISELDVPFLRDHTASPYLIGPNGFYLRDPNTEKPLVWCAKSGKAVSFDTAGADPMLTPAALAKKAVVPSAIETGPDGKRWKHSKIEARSGFDAMLKHLDNCTPEWAAEICGVDASKIRNLANDYLREARVGETIEIDGVTLPYRPVGVLLGKTVNNGWGAYACCWARAMLALVVGALEVPGGTIGTSVYLNRPTDKDGAVQPGPDGFMKQHFNPTDRENWSDQPKSRNAYNTLIPLVGDMPPSQALGPAHLPWILQDQPLEHLPEPSPPDVWFIYRTNPGISSWDTASVHKTMASFPFTVGFAYTVDESNHFADILLPDAMDLEGTQLIPMGGTKYMEQFWTHKGYGLRQNVVGLQGEARDFTDIATELAKRTGLLEKYNMLINKGLAGIKLKGANYDFRIDETKAHDMEAIWDAACRAASAELTDGKETDGLDWYRENGFRFQPFSQVNWYLFPIMKRKGIRFELPYQEQLTRIGRQLEARLHEKKIRWWDEQLLEYEPLPTWHDFPAIWERSVTKAGGKPEDFPFWMITTRSMQYAWGSNAALPVIKELADNVGGHRGVVINTATAEQLGIKDGDWIEVSSSYKSATGRAEVREGIRPDTVLALGQFGHWATPVAKDFGVMNMNDVTPIALDLTDANGSGSDLVRVAIRRVDKPTGHRG